MNHNVCFLQSGGDEVGGLVKIGTDVETLVIISRNVEHVGNEMLGVVQVYTFCCGEHSLDGMFYVMVCVLWRVLVFWAASRLPMNMPPLSPEGGTMQE